MRTLWKSISIFIWMGRALYGDFCEEISKDLSLIIQRTNGIQGQFERVIPFPDQGGSFINQVYLIYTDLGETFVLKVENPNWKNKKTMNEIIVLDYLNRFTSIPVPKVLA